MSKPSITVTSVLLAKDKTELAKQRKAKQTPDVSSLESQASDLHIRHPPYLSVSFPLLDLLKKSRCKLQRCLQAFLGIRVFLLRATTLQLLLIPLRSSLKLSL